MKAVIGLLCIAAALLISAATKRKTGSVSDTDSMTGPEFERWCAALLRRNQFRSVRVLGGSGDQGADIIAYKGLRKYVIQCKRYNRKLGNKPVQEANAAVEIYRGQVAVVMTNNFFTAGGVEAGRKCDVLLWDRKKLEEMSRR